MNWDEQQTATIGGAATDTDADTVGSLVGRTIGDYLLGEPLGEGGNGVVYRARQKTLDRDVVIKVLRHIARLGEDDRRTLRFLREAQLASGLDHPYAAHIYEFGVESDGVMWIAMELVRGTPLSTIVRTQGALPLARLLPLLEKICEVLHTAHGQGLVHRDIKPSNIMVLARAGRLLPKLLDFGIARKTMDAASDDKASDDKARTDTLEDEPPPPMAPLALLAASMEESAPTPQGASLGSPIYMAPEQWQDAAHVDARADQYALGVLTFEALTGRTPFYSSNVNVLSQAHASVPVPSLGPGFSPEIDAVVQRAMAKNPDDRYNDVLAFARALSAVAPLDGQSQCLLPLDQALVQLYLTKAPQPLADTMAALDAATSPLLAVRAASQIICATFRYLGIVALGAVARVGLALDEPNDHMAAALEVLQRMQRQRITSADWSILAHGLLRAFRDQPDAHPMPELVLLFHGTENTRQTSARLARLATLDASTHDTRVADTNAHDTPAHDNSGPTQSRPSLDRVREMLPDIEWLLKRAAFVCDYPVVVASEGRVASWAGARRAVHPLFALRGTYRPEDGEILLTGANDEPLLILSPLFQKLEPAPRTPEELFLLSGGGRHGALLTAYPAGFDRFARDIWPWLHERIPALANLDAAPKTSAEEHELAPYMGLSPFSRADADRFFGREREVEECVNRLRVEPFLAVVGPSGAGKSSFVHAGILSSLPERWRALSTRPGAQPIVALTACTRELGVAPEHQPTIADLTRDADALGRLLHAHAQAHHETIVLVIDQFEELLTLCSDRETRRQYAELLMRATRDPDAPIRVIITLRDDFLLRAQQVGPLSRFLGRCLLLLATPPPDELERILIEPARHAGYEFDDLTLPREMVDAVASEPSALALLSFTASKLWDQRDRQFKRLQRRVYKELGGVGGALSRHAEGVLDEMTDDEQALVREVFRQLVTAEGTRAILTRRELTEVLGDDARTDGVLEKLINARLLVAREVRVKDPSTTRHSAAAAVPRNDDKNDQRRTPSDTSSTDMDSQEPGDHSEREGPEHVEDHIEVVHEALLSSWPRLLGWQRADAESARLRDQVRAAARQWHDRGRPKGLLWRDDALLEYRVWRARYQGAHTRIEEAFASASLRQDARGRRLKRALALGAFAIMAVVVIVVLGLNRDLSTQRDRTAAFAQAAESSADESRQRLAELQREQGRQALLAGEPMRAFVYLREALRGGRPGNTTDDRLDDPATRFMLGRAVDALDGERLVWQAHTANITAVCFSPDGALVASAAESGAAKIWDARTGALVHTLVGHEQRIWALEFDAAGTRLVTASADHTVRVWDPRTGTAIWTGQHDDVIRDVAFSGDGARLVTGGWDAKAKVWRVSDGRLLQVFADHGRRVQAVAMDATGAHVVTGDVEQITRVWHVDSGAMLTAAAPLGQAVSDIAVSPDGELVAAASWSGHAQVFPLAGPASQGHLLEGHDAAIMSIAFSPDSDRVVTASLDDTARIWDPRTGEALAVMKAHPGGLSRAMFSANGRRVFTFGYDGLAKAWSVDASALAWTYVGHRGLIWSADVGSDGSNLITGGDDGTVRIWNARQQDHLLTLPELSDVPGVSEPPDVSRIAVQHALFSPDQTRIATVDAAGRVRVWSAAGELNRSMTMNVQHLYHTKWLAWHPNGHRLLGSGAVAAEEWDVRTGARIHVFNDHGDAVLHATYSPDGERIATAGADGVIRVRDANTGQVILTLSGDHGPIRYLDYAPDGRRMVSVAQDGTVTFWNADTGVPESLRFEHPQEINSARFSPDGTRVVIASEDKNITIYSAVSGERSLVLEGHTNEIANTVFSPDGQLIASACDDRTIKVWDASSGTLLWSLALDQMLGGSVEFSPDGRALLGAFGRRVRVWNIEYERRTNPALDAFVACRIDDVFAHGKLKRVQLDYRGCFGE